MPSEQFETILDEALALLSSGKPAAEIARMFPEHQTELVEFLETAANLEMHKQEQNLKATFSKILEALPAVSVAKQKTSFSFNSLFTNMAKILFSRRFAAGALGVLLVVYSAGFFIYQQVVAPQLVVATAPASLGGPQEFGLTTRTDLNEASVNQTAPGAVGQAEYVGLSAKVDMMPVYYNPPTPNANDTREFLKTNYRATLKTRDVVELGGHVQTVIRGFKGRVDSATLDEKYGYISFVVPENKFDEFKAELKSLVGKRFFSQGVTVENLLGQKQNIEDNTASVTTAKKDLEAQKTKLTTSHNATIYSLNKQLADVTAQIKAYDEEVKITSDSVRLEQIRNLQIPLATERLRLQKAIAYENSEFVSQRNSLDWQIKQTNNQLSSLAKEDKNLIDNVNTVQGTITLTWISIPQIIALYVPMPWSPLVVGVIILGYLTLTRHKKVEVQEVI